MLGSLIFTGVGTFIKLAGQHLDPLQIAFFRAAFGLAFILPVLLRARMIPWRTPRLAGHFWRTVVGAGSMVCGFYAAARLPLADSTAISFSQPLFIVAVSALALGETVRWRRWGATIVGFVGVLIMLRPQPGAFDPAALAAILSAFLTACAVMLVKKLSETEPPLQILATFAMFSTLFLLPAAIPVWRWPTPAEWIYVSAIGVLATLGQYCMVRAYAAGEASFVAPFDYLRLPFSVALGFFVFAELPTLWTAVGTAVIAVSTLYIARREAVLGKTLPGEVKRHKPPA